MFDTKQYLQHLSNAIHMSLWHDLHEEDEEEIPSGAWVNFIDDDTGEELVGKYIDLWQHDHPDETSPYWNDTRVMAFIEVYEKYGIRTTYADVEYITPLDDDELAEDVEILEIGQVA